MVSHGAFQRRSSVRTHRQDNQNGDRRHSEKGGQVEVNEHPQPSEPLGPRAKKVVTALAVVKVARLAEDVR